MSLNLKNQYSHAAVIIPVPDIVKTIDFYTARLGFELTFEWGEPLEYAVGKLGQGTNIHFTQSHDKVSYPTSLYVFVHDVDVVYNELKRKEVNITNKIGNRDYGMRDFDIHDINNFRLTFGTSII